MGVPSPDGTFQFADIAGGSYRLFAAVPSELDGGYQMPGSVLVTVADTGTTTQNVSLGLGAKVAGTVRFPDGTPAANQRLHLH